MKTFVIAAETINDDAMFSEYRKHVAAMIERFVGAREQPERPA